MPAITGSSSTLDRIRHSRFGHPRKENSNNATTMTNIRKLVPHRGCRVGKDRAFSKTLALAAGKLMALPFSVWRIAKKIDNVAQTYSAETDGAYIGTVAALTYGEREIYKREWFAETVELTFEGRSCPAPQAWDAMLTQVYGDYMTPPKDADKNHHKSEIIAG